ncbi:hypothetical protein JPSP56_19510 [Staphylococcus pseudintermedius]
MNSDISMHLLFLIEVEILLVIRIDISCNRLSCYANGTSSITTGLINRICEKFDVFYLDIVGKDK